MAAKGVVTMGDTRYEFKPGDAFAGLDWGRGYWTYKTLVLGIGLSRLWIQ